MLCNYRDTQAWCFEVGRPAPSPFRAVELWGAWPEPYLPQNYSPRLSQIACTHSIQQSRSLFLYEVRTSCRHLMQISRASRPHRTPSHRLRDRPRSSRHRIPPNTPAPLRHPRSRLHRLRLVRLHLSRIAGRTRRAQGRTKRWPSSC